MIALSRTILLTLAACLVSATAQAANIYVDNSAGNDVWDGLSPSAISPTSGPVRSISRGLALVRRGDTLNIANHGTPYYESLSIVGSRFSGEPKYPFVIHGNGAVVDGSLVVPAGAWTRVAGNVWKMVPWRKGFALLLNNGAPLPETPAPAGEPRPELPVGNWCLWKGTLYFHAEERAEPAELPLSFAVRDVGLTLFNVHDLVVSDLTFRHFRIDGVNAHDQCRRVTLNRIVSTENARAGLTAAGSAAVVASGCDFTHNRVESVRLEEVGGVELNESKVDAAPEPPGPPSP